MMCIAIYLDYFLLINNHAEKVMICLAYVPWQALLHASLHGRPKLRMELGLLLEPGPGASNTDLAAADMSKVLQVKITAEQAEMDSPVDKPFTNKPFGLLRRVRAAPRVPPPGHDVDVAPGRGPAPLMASPCSLPFFLLNNSGSRGGPAVSRSQLETSMPRRWMVAWDCGWALGASSLESAAVVAATRSGSNVDARMLRREEGGRRGRKKNKGLE
uniref:Uncharacterized protein n=1 Tax=Oryza barthii TaxID=65489 RepID=A0A0D3HCJ3_9ORYZ